MMLNQDLQATSEILSLMERSKSRAESFLDALPGLFFVIGPDGVILRGNESGSKLLGAPLEAVPGHSLSHLFSVDGWAAFKSRLDLLSGGASQREEFELPLDSPGGGGPSGPHLWQLTPFAEEQRGGPRLFTVIGKDITELKKALSEVVSLEKDLEVTHVVQSLFLPTRDTLRTDRYRVAAYYQSACKSGGDWWWLDERPDGGLDLFLGDVTGHGAGAAMMTAVVASSFHALRRIHPQFRDAPGIPGLFDAMSSNLRSIGGARYSMSFVAVEIAPASRELRVWSAGAPPIYTMKASGVMEAIVRPSGLLGDESVAVGSAVRGYEPGERLFLFTDGVYEIEVSGEVRFGLSGLRKFLKAERPESIEDLRGKLASQIETMRAGAPPSDDASFILVELT